MKKVKVGAATMPTDLLVCFPARQHLALMPKSMCSPSRATLDRAVAARRRQLQLPAACSGPSGGGGGGGPGGRGRGSSPLFRGGSKAKQTVEGGVDEPQSPKVTCAGQIKVVRPRKPRPAVATEQQNGRCGGSGRRWITVSEEIERLQEQRKKGSWLEDFGIRRDALPFLGGALRSLRHKVVCFGSSLHAAAVDSSTDDDDDDGAIEHEREPGAGASVFSKWLMVLEESQEPHEQDSRDDDDEERTSREAHDDCSKLPSVPPPNALLLMRCRSAPAKGLARKGAEEPTDGEETAHEKASAEEEDRDEMVFMRTAPDFLKLSIDIAKETWVVGGVDALARSRSWKR